MRTVYLDYNASTPIDPRVLREMLPYLKNHHGNPSSNHIFGIKNKKAIERARERVSNLLGCRTFEVVFTSGGTESNNHALKGIAFANRGRGDHIITTQIEHPSVLETCRFLEKSGFKVTYLPVDKDGLVNPADVKNAITSQTILMSIMHANNEVGTVQPIDEIGEIARDRVVTFHTDAAQSIGKVPVKVEALKVDLLTVAGHKFYAPKGVGALFIKEGTRLEPHMHGGGHEGGRRASTENTPSIVALGKAAQIVEETMDVYVPKVKALRDRLHSRLAKELDELELNGHPEKRLLNTLNLSFKGVVGDDLLEKLPAIAASTGSACHSGSMQPSPVLTAMGIPRDIALGAVRFSLGKYSTREEVDYTVRAVSNKVRGIRSDVRA